MKNSLNNHILLETLEEIKITANQAMQDADPSYILDSNILSSDVTKHIKEMYRTLETNTKLLNTTIEILMSTLKELQND